jgi:hypothetical protein
MSVLLRDHHHGVNSIVITLLLLLLCLVLPLVLVRGCTGRKTWMDFITTITATSNTGIDVVDIIIDICNSTSNGDTTTYTRTGRARTGGGDTDGIGWNRFLLIVGVRTIYVN